MGYVGNAPGQGGNIIRQVFAAGVGFTAGTSTTITLSTIPATSWSVVIHFNGVFQDSTQYSVNLSTGVITFTSAIPADITEIETLQVQVLNVGVPATGSVVSGSFAATDLALSGSIGLGVALSSWQAGIFKFIEMGNPGNAIGGQIGTNQVSITGNAYYNGGWLYGTSAAASQYYVLGGAHYFSVAPSGTANAAITWTPAFKIDNSGNVLVTGSGGLGYGTGSGGTVTQLTSKATAVTLNKPTGQITMNAAAVAAGAVVTFGMNNTSITTNDVVLVILNGSGITNSANYNVWGQSASGTVYITLKNVSAGSLSEAVGLNFAVIKGATA